MNLFDTYRFKVKFPTKAEQIVYPMNDEITINWKKDKDFRFFRWEMSESLIFRNERDRDILTFNDFADIEIGQQPCGKVTLKIERKCKGETEWSPFWEGYLARPDREYNVDDCLVTVKPRTEDDYTCILNTWEREANIFQFVFNKITAKTRIGQYDYRDCTVTTRGPVNRYIDDCVQGESGWRVIEHKEEYDVDNEEVVTTTTWIREQVFGGANPPVGGGWVLEGGKWVRPPVLIYRGIQSNVNAYEELWQTIDYEIDNGVLLRDVLEGFAASCLFDNYDTENPKFVSNFYGIAPDGTQPDNEAYTAAFENLQNLAIWQITDVAKRSATQNAVNGLLTWKKLLLDLKRMHNVYWLVDNNGVLRLEHFSYFRKEKRMDLQQELWEKFLKGKGKFTFDKEELPFKENFKWPNQTRFFFDGVPIEYDINCSDPEKEDVNTVELFLTDLEFIIQNPSDYEESPLFVMANLTEFNGEYAFQSEKNPATLYQNPDENIARINGHLSWPNLLDNYHRHGRKQEGGLLNLSWVLFDSFNFIKKQEQITIPFGCCDISQFQPEDLVNANFGWSEIEEASYTLKKQVMTLDLKF